LIGRGPLRRSHVLAVSVLTAGLVLAGFLTYPSPAYAGSRDNPASISHVVLFTTDGATSENASSAATVGDFLQQHGINVADADYITPSLDTPLSDRMSIEYRAAVPVTIVMGNRRETLLTSAPNVGALLDAENIHLGAADLVRPSIDQTIPSNGVVHVIRVLQWERIEKRAIAMLTVRRTDLALRPGTTKVIAKGHQGERDVTVAFEQRDGQDITARVIASHVVSKPRPRIIVFSPKAIAMAMIATAYTADCGGCSGVTAIGRPAGYGIVAVDPSVIPLGTHLYIPGYGSALAGDTGGAIRGNRIDLGFNSFGAAMRFGRRAVTVYRLR
jgi:3D (Asp-Asp-Asp) domain-containing protein